MIRYLGHKIPPIASLAKIRKTTPRILEARLKRSLKYFLGHTAWPKLPQGEGDSLILIADAKVKFIEKKWHSFYLMLLKRPGDDFAAIAPPYHQEGTETANGWHNAIESLPESVKSSIKAIVCDGHRGLVNYAKWHKWLIQRCHFHLIASVQGRRSKWKRSRHRQEGDDIYRLVKYVLTAKEETNIIQYINQIEDIGWQTKSPQLAKILSGFVNNYKDYRTHLYHPELNLPRTSNSVESLIGCAENLISRAKGFCTLPSFLNWLNALIKHKKKIKCNGFYQPN